MFEKSIIENVYNQRFISNWLFDIKIFLRLKKHIRINDLLHRISKEPLDRWIEVEGSKITLKESFLIPINQLMIWFNYSKIRTVGKNVSENLKLKLNDYITTIF